MGFRPCLEAIEALGGGDRQQGRLILRQVGPAGGDPRGGGHGNMGVRIVTRSMFETGPKRLCQRKTVEKRICLKRSTGTGLRAALARRLAPCSEETMKAAISSQSRLGESSPASLAALRQ